eukprot:scaffold7825_cov162-Amphora_coffeaeformis.AAC.3
MDKSTRVAIFAGNEDRHSQHMGSLGSRNHMFVVGCDDRTAENWNHLSPSYAAKDHMISFAWFFFFGQMTASIRLPRQFALGCTFRKKENLPIGLKMTLTQALE